MRLTPRNVSVLVVPALALAVLYAALVESPLQGGAEPADGKSSPTAMGIEKRIPWTTSRIVGSPEPPLPYDTERAFPSLKFNQPLDIATAPGMDRLWIVEQSGKIYSFANRPDVESADLALDVARDIPGQSKFMR